VSESTDIITYSDDTIQSLTEAVQNGDLTSFYQALTDAGNTYGDMGLAGSSSGIMAETEAMAVMGALAANSGANSGDIHLFGSVTHLKTSPPTPLFF
jgi:hypothetical protein